MCIVNFMAVNRKFKQKSGQGQTNNECLFMCRKRKKLKVGQQVTVKVYLTPWLNFTSKTICVFLNFLAITGK